MRVGAAHTSRSRLPRPPRRPQARGCESSGSDLICELPGGGAGSSGAALALLSAAAGAGAGAASGGAGGAPGAPPPAPVLTSMAGVDALAPRLRVLALPYHALTRIEAVTGCAELRELRLHDNALAEVGGLAG